MLPTNRWWPPNLATCGNLPETTNASTQMQRRHCMTPSILSLHGTRRRLALRITLACSLLLGLAGQAMAQAWPQSPFVSSCPSPPVAGVGVHATIAHVTHRYACGPGPQVQIQPAGFWSCAHCLLPNDRRPEVSDQWHPISDLVANCMVLVSRFARDPRAILVKV